MVGMIRWICLVDCCVRLRWIGCFSRLVSSFCWFGSVLVLVCPVNLETIRSSRNRHGSIILWGSFGMCSRQYSRRPSGCNGFCLWEGILFRYNASTIRTHALWWLSEDLLYRYSPVLKWTGSISKLRRPTGWWRWRTIEEDIIQRLQGMIWTRIGVGELGKGGTVLNGTWSRCTGTGEKGKKKEM